MEAYSWSNDNFSPLLKTTAHTLKNPECWFISHFGFNQAKKALSHQGLKSQFKARKPFLSITFSLRAQTPASTKSAKTINFVNFEQRLI
jgi:hypothetical protein